MNSKCIVQSGDHSEIQACLKIHNDLICQYHIQHLDGTLMLSMPCCWRSPVAERDTHRPTWSWISTHPHTVRPPNASSVTGCLGELWPDSVFWQNKQVHLNAAHRYLQHNARQWGNKLQRNTQLSVFHFSSLRCLKHSHKINQPDLL